MMVSRREWLGLTFGGVAAALATGASDAFASALSKPVRFTVYKTPTCGCCRAWVTHARSIFTDADIKTVDMGDLSEVKAQLGIPASLQSCHTVVTGPYVFEGHVPADLMKRFLDERPKALGLAVPGMPAGSPGMEVGGYKDRYDVLLFEKSGKTRVYAKR